ncbi:unnamed protein product [Albugo candida]|uniref:Uncharacterized protein n=1 Tax=Albugo candida TaxID=65357 RepID=A0A024G6U2_9STRA|nr:unnamed protein product [Albugo candida]|eukprot:CCI42279.1 unnamed protein product [Albugo candida]
MADAFVLKNETFGETKSTCEKYCMHRKLSNLAEENADVNDNQMDPESEIPMMEVGSSSSCTSSEPRTTSPPASSDWQISDSQISRSRTRERLHQLARSNNCMEQDRGANVLSEIHQAVDTTWAFNDSNFPFELEGTGINQQYGFADELCELGHDLWCDDVKHKKIADQKSHDDPGYFDERSNFEMGLEDGHASDESFFRESDVVGFFEKEANTELREGDISTTEIGVEHAEIFSDIEIGTRPKRDENFPCETSSKETIDFMYSLPAETTFDGIKNSGAFWDEIDVESAIDEDFYTEELIQNTSDSTMASVYQSKESVQTVMRRVTSVLSEWKTTRDQDIYIRLHFQHATQMCELAEWIRAYVCGVSHGLYAAFEFLYSVLCRGYPIVELGLRDLIRYLATTFQKLDDGLNLFVLKFVENVLQAVSSWFDPAYNFSEHFVANLSRQTSSVHRNTTSANSTSRSEYVWITKEMEKIKSRRILLEDVLESVLLETQMVLEKSCNDTKLASFEVMKQLKTSGDHMLYSNVLKEVSEYEDIVSTHTSLLQKEIDIIRSRKQGREQSYESPAAARQVHHEQCSRLETFRGLFGNSHGINAELTINPSLGRANSEIGTNGKTAKSICGLGGSDQANIQHCTQVQSFIKAHEQRIIPDISIDTRFSSDTLVSTHMTQKTLKRVSAFSLFSLSIFLFLYLRHRQTLSRKRQALHAKRWQKRMSDSAILRTEDDDVLEFIPARAPVHAAVRPLSMSTHVRRSRRIATAHYNRYSAP